MVLKKSTIKDWIFALLLYVGNVFLPGYFYLILLPFIPKIFFFRNKNNNELFIIFIIIFLSTLNFYLNPIKSNFYYGNINELIPYTFFMIPTFFIGKYMNDNIKRFFLYFVIFESFIIILQFFIGVHSFWPENYIMQDNIESDMLYKTRPYGLGFSASIVAIRLLLGIIIINCINIKRKYFYLGSVIILIAIIFNFNRSVLVATSCFYIILLFRYKLLNVIKELLHLRIKKSGILLFFSILLLSLILIKNIDSISYQLKRGQNSLIESTSRISIYEYGLNFTKSHLMLGNGSQKLLWKHYDKIYHMHNSFLQVIASHGILIFLLFLLLLYSRFKTNKEVVTYIIIYSMFQYGIFWGISILDIFLFSDFTVNKFWNKELLCHTSL